MDGANRILGLIILVFIKEPLFYGHVLIKGLILSHQLFCCVCASSYNLFPLISKSLQTLQRFAENRNYIEVVNLHLAR